MNGGVVEYRIKARLRDALDGTWHGGMGCGVEESVAEEKARKMGKHDDDNGLSIARKEAMAIYSSMLLSILFT